MSVTTPTAFWKMEEAAGATRLSQYGGYSLTDNGTVGQAAGKIGNAATMARASNQWLSSVNAVFSPGNASYSFAGWVKATTVTTSQTVLGKDKTAAREYLLILSNTTSKRLEYIPFLAGAPTANVVDTHDLVNDTYVHVAFGFDKAGGKAWIQVNGGTRVEAAVANHAAATGAEFRVGGREIAADSITGAWDALGYWNGYSLTSAEVIELYNGGTGMELPSSDADMAATQDPAPAFLAAVIAEQGGLEPVSATEWSRE